VSKCAVTLGAPSTPLPASGGTGTVTVRTERECQWTAASEAAWLTLSGGTTGQGDGSIQFTVGANADPVQRTGAIVANDARVQLPQAAAECRFELASASASFPKSGGSGSVQVRASSALCAWTAASPVEWIDIRSGAEGKGTATVTYDVDATTGPPRTGAMTIAGKRHTVTQSEGCTFSIAPEHQSMPATGGTGAVNVGAGEGCVWNARSTADWITITSGVNGSGPGSVAYSVAANQGPSRNGAITAGGRTFTIEQASSCQYAISPTARDLGNVGETVTVSVTTNPLCSWTAKSNASWIGVSSGASGNGGGDVQLAIAGNTGESRTGTATIGGQTFTVNQAGCEATLSPTYQLIPPVGAVGAFTVNTPVTCPWRAEPSASWIEITTGATGMGQGTVGFHAHPNSGAARRGTISVLGQSFSVQQEAASNTVLSPDTALTPAAANGSLVSAGTAALAGRR
jgi:hypothetical protein